MRGEGRIVVYLDESFVKKKFQFNLYASFQYYVVCVLNDKEEVGYSRTQIHSHKTPSIFIHTIILCKYGNVGRT